ncbi:MAG TPA: hydrogenase maturation protease [Thermoanaerobaculia bacterium]|nr:hydrogenase maturation protease [Thermoanaerobaculia bacterium]
MQRIAVLGLGNVLMGDDAAGPYVLRLLEAGYDLPAEVDLRDLGTPGPELAHIVEGLDALIVVDTLRVHDGAPGDLHLLRRPEIVKGRVPERLSPHDPSLRGALLAAELLGQSPPEALLVGIVPGQAELGIGLTPEVREALPAALAEVVKELERLGVPAGKRAEAAERVEVWWEGGPTYRDTSADMSLTYG